MALFRAIESARPPERRLFEDLCASGLLPRSLQVVAQLARVPVVGPVVPWFIDRRWPGARASGVARTRLIDDRLAQALRDGIEQVVILGAGFDGRAYRIAGIERTRVFEVDHPDTLAAKRARLLQTRGSLPAHVAFVEIDFDTQRLGDVLRASGFGAAHRTFFIWEGVTNYLTESAVAATFRFISTTASASEVFFTYVHRGVLQNAGNFRGTHQLARTLRHASEPWTFGFDPAELPAYLKARGLELIEDVGSLEYRARYISPQGRHMRGYEFYRAALARVIGGR